MTKKVNQAAGGATKTAGGAASGLNKTASGAVKNAGGAAGGEFEPRALHALLKRQRLTVLPVGAVGDLADTGKQTAGAIRKGDIKGAASGLASGTGQTVAGIKISTTPTLIYLTDELRSKGAGKGVGSTVSGLGEGVSSTVCLTLLCGMT